MTRTDDTLTAEYIDNTWTVIDSEGGRWWPDEQTERNTGLSHDPAQFIVSICRDDPARGEWKS